MFFVFLVKEQTESHHYASAVMVNLRAYLENDMYCAGHINRIYGVVTHGRSNEFSQAGTCIGIYQRV